MAKKKMALTCDLLERGSLSLGYIFFWSNSYWSNATNQRFGAPAAQASRHAIMCHTTRLGEGWTRALRRGRGIDLCEQEKAKTECDTSGKSDLSGFRRPAKLGSLGGICI